MPEVRSLSFGIPQTHHPLCPAPREAVVGHAVLNFCGREEHCWMCWHFQNSKICADQYSACISMRYRMALQMRDVHLQGPSCAGIV